MNIHVDGPFGGCDEQAETEAFEYLVGGPSRAFRLLRLWEGTIPAATAYDLLIQGKTKKKRKEELFRINAKREGYTDDQIEAFLHLQ